jgi:hypothetical protein
MQILFDHFMDGIDSASYKLYDLRSLRCKEYSSREIIKLFRKFESIVVSKDSFWEKSPQIKYISGDGLKELSLGDYPYFIVNEGYRTDTEWHFFNPLVDAWFCSSLHKRLLFQSSERWCKEDGICLKYLSTTSKFHKYYGETEFKKHIHPHTDVLFEAIVEIFSLKKFPDEEIRSKKVDDINESFKWALGNDKYEDFFNIIINNEKNIRPLLTAEVIALSEEYKDLKRRTRELKGKITI